MNKLLVVVTGLTLGVALSGCETASTQSKKSFKARVTYYSNTTCPYGSKVACSSKIRAQEGITVAASKKYFNFGTQLFIRGLRGLVKCGPFEVQDRGSAVESEKASHKTAPVIDVYIHAASHREGVKRERYLASINPDYLEVDILNPENIHPVILQKLFPE